MKIKKFLILTAFLTIWGAGIGRAQGLGDLLGGGNLGNTLGNLIEGVFSSSDITIADMAGEWQASGPAVCFQGEGFLKKAGGAAAAAAVETKLSPYYEQYGLNNSTLTIDKEGAFSLTCKAIKLSGTITRNESAEPGVFEFNFSALGMKLASVTTYVQKTSSSMDIMFDATKLKKLLSAVSSFTGIQIVKTVSGILDSYDGLAIGSHYNCVRSDSDDSDSGFSLGSLLGGLKGGNKQQSDSTAPGQTAPDNSGKTQTQPDEGNQENNAVSTGINILRGILGGNKKK